MVVKFNNYTKNLGLLFSVVPFYTTELLAHSRDLSVKSLSALPLPLGPTASQPRLGFQHPHHDAHKVNFMIFLSLMVLLSILHVAAKNFFPNHVPSQKSVLPFNRKLIKTKTALPVGGLR